eukprot:12883043-Prorocentrum_lima.AAC.1
MRECQERRQERSDLIARTRRLEQQITPLRSELDLARRRLQAPAPETRADSVHRSIHSEE